MLAWQGGFRRSSCNKHREMKEMRTQSKGNEREKQRQVARERQKDNQ